MGKGERGGEIEGEREREREGGGVDVETVERGEMED